eukprot:CAMPEP_0113878422 /NCGR_PEP_ID=MMETSP0780_2-20120614/6669_1 /TAXON_ID=652834 /ORGANISM="Palpitomonas bilix" /LENGTH=140 /DNA_ID=CAMNT_0000864881 /DNA_START=106 /DNA_END=528 /DNA_ORIENTATION=- /assembly_acc=CAM_ASM_000599
MDAVIWGVLLISAALFISRRWTKKEEPEPPLPEPEKRDYTEEELTKYNGSDPSLPLLLSIKGVIFDVTPKPSFYGPEGPYNCFTGRDCSRGFALHSTREEDCHDNLEGLTKFDLEQLDNWYDSFEMKYDLVGKLIKSQSK